MKPEDLIQVFNKMIFLLTPINRGKKESDKHPGLGIIGLNETNREIAGELLAFFRERDIHPQAYLAGCFAKGSWTYRPPFIQLSNEEYLKWWYDNKAVAFQWWDNIRKEWEAEEPVEVARGADIVKRRYLAEGGAALCRANEYFTGGFHKGSPVCRQCPERGVCGSR